MSQQEKPDHNKDKKYYITRRKCEEMENNSTNDCKVKVGQVGGGRGANSKCDKNCSNITGSGADGDAKHNRNRRKKPLNNSMEQLHLRTDVGDSSGNIEVKSNICRRAAGSNWDAGRNESNKRSSIMQHQQQKQTNHMSLIPEEHSSCSSITSSDPSINCSKIPNNDTTNSKNRRRKRRKAEKNNHYVAMDCEMVGVGLNGHDDMLARVSIVNKVGEVLLDKYVKPRQIVTDYRTPVSGIRPQDVENASDFNAVQEEVIALLQGKILVGHAIRNDLAVLHIKHPFVNIRDTSRYKPLCRLVANGRTPSLKNLSQAILGVKIQIGEHNSVEDAKAAMNIYNTLSDDWEKFLQRQRQKN